MQKTGKETLHRVEFTVEKKGKRSREALEGKNLSDLLDKVKRLDGFLVEVYTEIT